MIQLAVVDAKMLPESAVTCEMVYTVPMPVAEDKMLESHHGN